MNIYQATRLVAAREIRVKLRDRTFLFSTLFFLLHRRRRARCCRRC